MIRVVLAIIGVFFLPFFIYVAFMYVRNGGELRKDFLQDAPVNWLAVAGTILAMATLASLVSTEIIEYESQQPATGQNTSTQTPGRNP